MLLVPAGLAALSGIALVVAGLPHGMDWSDEAFVWTMIASDRVAAGEAWGFQHLLHPVWTLTGETVLTMRVLRLLGYLAVSVVVTWAAIRVLTAAGVRLNRRERGLVLLVAQAGTLLVWTYPPRYLGYNELSAWLSALLCAALAVGLVPLEDDDRRRRVAPWLVAGLLVVPLTMAKFTAAVVWMVVLLVALALPVTGSARWMRLAGATAGAVLCLGVMRLLGVPFVTVTRNALHMLTDSSAQQASRHSIDVIIHTYLDSTRTTLRAVVLPLLLLLAFALVCTLSGRRRWLAVIAAGVLAAAFVAVQAGAAVEGTFPGLGAIATSLGLGAGGALAVVARTESSRASAGPRPWRLVLVVLLALATPLIAPIGTNNAIWAHTVFSAMPWAVLCGVALCLLARVAPPVVRAAPVLLAGAVVALATAAVLEEVTVHPYRSFPLLDQTSPTSVPPLRGIALNDDQAAVANWLHATAIEQEAEGVPAVAMATPGYLFMFNRSGWASPWAGGSWQASIARSCRRETPEDLFVIQPVTPRALIRTETRRLQAALTSCDLRFPEDFRVVAERNGAKVWRLTAAGPPR
ncbi:hypothetical protein N798_10420 [Knoellia flava TL1]|uniref:Uncharacterized protein n=2 Tax=Knoellia flava TaxID=913969 RepID=A0A8H9FRY7_9MICO|nr:hypothetical protein [Knoellia flava]KGN30603.1 hypothetical protein N798_10420 [Knoellia flava TL1]GGB77281.1 hypothetical protein GCM10011314_16160 [Knoellia flava]